MLQASKKYHEHGLAQKYIVVYNLGEFVMCMDTDYTGEESKVYSWEEPVMYQKCDMKHLMIF
nr:SMI1/KNR4 family protein [Listeria booriae]